MIFHGRFKRILPLLVNGDLSPDREARLLHHLDSCPDCTAELDELRQLRVLISNNAGQAVNAEQLEDARGRLSARLSQSKSVQHSSILQEFMESLRPRRTWIAVAGTLGALLVGILSGRYLLPAGEERNLSFASSIGGEDVSVTNLRIIDGSGADGELELIFNATRAMHVRGSLDNPMVQRVIARAIVSGENPGIRMRAASSTIPRTTDPGDREIKAALVLAMKTDPNDGVRKAALEALLRYPADIEIRDGLVQVLLADENPGLRMAAINGLGAMATQGFTSDPVVRGSLEDRLRDEENLFVRTKTESLLKGRIQ